MAIADTINRIYREFRRFSGDGLPNEPINAPLPVGDSSSGVYSPKKSELRAAFMSIATDMDGSIAQAAAEADRAEEAAAAALSAVTGIIAPKATVAMAIADDPDVDPAYYDIAYFDTSYQTGSGSKWKKVGSNPGLPAGAAFQNANGTWYVNDSQWLRPEHFGRIGVSAAGDTAAWTALIGTANARGGDIFAAFEWPVYLPNGTGTVDDALTFKNLSSVWVKLGVDTEVRQQIALAKTFKFLNVGKVKVTGGHLIGYAQKQIDAAQPLTELNLEASGGNAVAAIYAEATGRGKALEISRVKTTNHFGRDIFAYGIELIKCRDLDLSGVGPLYNDPTGGAYPTRYPISGPHQGNGEDAAIYAIPNRTGSTYFDPNTSTAYHQVLEVCNCTIKWHSFCIRTILNKTLRLQGNFFGETPGQHHVYDTDSDGLSIIGNQFEKCRQHGLKTQFENLAGTMYGADWQPATAYQVGDIRRAVSIVWVCKTAHTSGGSFSSTNWVQQERYLRRGAIISGNIYRDCGEGAVGIIASSAVDARNIWAEGYIIADNDIEDCGYGLYLQRLWKSTVKGNNIRNCTRGIFGTDFGGSMSGNDLSAISLQAILISLSHSTTMSGNTFIDCSRLGADDEQKTPVVIYAPTGGVAPPATQAIVYVFFHNNGIMFLNLDGVGAVDAVGPYLVFVADSGRTRTEVVGTYGTATAKLFRIDGALWHKFRNHFPGYHNASMNEPVPTDAATTITALRSKRVVA